MQNSFNYRCCICGGGPAGIMLGYLLARAGIEIIVLEKHEDFFRDFRGDTIHPSTLELMHELGLLDDFIKIPHQSLDNLEMNFQGQTVRMADFSHLPVTAKYIAFMPQWDFLNFISAQAARYKGFNLWMGAEARETIMEDGKVKGVKLNTKGEEKIIYSSLVIDADGRSSTIRQSAGLPVKEMGVPIDVLWFRISKHNLEQQHSLGYFKGNKLMIVIDRNEYFQCGFIIPKNTFDAFRSRGLNAFQKDITDLAPFLSSSATEINNWDEVKLLTVQINHLTQWYLPGLLCIGDAAHAMSPAGGVGINLAIQDAVAAANILAPALKENNITTALLKKVQQRRETPAIRIQKLQAFVHNQIVNPTAKSKSGNRMKVIVWLFKHFPFLSRIPGRIIGMGFLPEHIQTKEDGNSG